MKSLLLVGLLFAQCHVGRGGGGLLPPEKCLKYIPHIQGLGDEGPPKIVGGEQVTPHTFPWQAFVQGDYLCGGTIICPNFVMSAAHCNYDRMGNYLYPKKTMTVYIGLHDTRNIYTEGTKHSIEDDLDHPLYHPSRHDYDFTLYKLGEPIQFRPEARPIHLSYKQHRDVNYVVSGWGALWFMEGEEPERARFLMAVMLESVSDEYCEDKFGDMNPEIMLCAMGDRKNSCVGDSGGPLVVLDRKTDQIQLEGVVSFGAKRGCALPGIPVVYAKIPAVTDWIEETTGDCNTKTCGEDECMTGDKLDPDAMERFFQ